MTVPVAPPTVRPRPVELPGLVRLRLVLLVLVLAAATGGLVQLPVWSRLLLAATAAAVPGAVAVQYGTAAVRLLLRVSGGGARVPAGARVLSRPPTGARLARHPFGGGAVSGGGAHPAAVPCPAASDNSPTPFRTM
ncbi:hypothetical protein [Plantactinospora sonchi]|uniref:Uncharacterized protein n=1 Tax=Plantactinospora sonchi TaxID=1544735 RepID=A0ABU7RRQ3_9ACTN